MHRAQYLRQHADWFLDLATRSGSGNMFEKLIGLAAAYQQKAVEVEREFGRNPVLIAIPGGRR